MLNNIPLSLCVEAQSGLPFASVIRFWHAFCCHSGSECSKGAPNFAGCEVKDDDRDNFSGVSRDGLGVWTPDHTSGIPVDAQVRRAQVAAPSDLSRRPATRRLTDGSDLP